MMKIVIQNQDCETVINNIQPEDLIFWQDLLDKPWLEGRVKIIDLDTQHQVA